MQRTSNIRRETHHRTHLSHPSLLVLGLAAGRDDLRPLSLDVLLHPVVRRDYPHFQLLLILARAEDIEHFITELGERRNGLLVIMSIEGTTELY